MKTTNRFNTRHLVVLAMLTAILLVMSYTPLGYLNIGPLAISLNMIPVAIGAVALGPKAGAFLGGVFGITSCLQCVGIGGTSAMGVILFEISPVRTIIQRLLTRILAGFLSGWLFVALRKLTHRTVTYFMTGFCAAALNTLLFMLALVLLFGQTDYVQSLMAGRSIIAFVCTFVGVNALVEMFAATAAVGLVCKALEKTKIIGGN